MGIEVCVGNYGYYNEGMLVDKWIELPMDAVVLQKWLERSGLMDDQHEEIYISDYDGIPLGMSYGNVFSECTRLEDLNILAAVMEKHPDEVEHAEKIIALGVDEPEDVIEVCNMILQVDDWPYYSYGSEIDMKYFEHDSNEMKFGYYLAELDGTMRYLQEHDLESYFDFEHYGRANSHNCHLGEEGYVDAACDFPSMDYWSRDEIIEHRSALDEGGQVILTMMSGTSYPYPTTSTDVIETARERGLILGGEGEQGSPTKDATARRDSIFLAILAQSQAPLIVCGAKMPSGTTRVMEAAADLGLGVLAFPGPITDNGFDGTNRMIAQHRASLITNPSAALEAEALRQLVRREARERLGMTGLESEMHAAIELQDSDRAGDRLKPTQPPIGT